jgi:hypothetical protein
VNARRWGKCLALVLVSCQGSAASIIPDSRAEGSHPESAPSVVLELFTSEGCSSCPPADDLLAELAADPRVFALSFHVDYWDQLGWPDRFASAENTARQQAYARSLGASGLYTPELVVGGASGFVGSNRSRAHEEIASQLRTPPQVTLSIQPRLAGADVLEVVYSVSGAPARATVNVALVDREATTQVRAGENAGRTLRHVDVVRAFASSVASSAGTLRLKLPSGSRPAGEDVIGFVQRPAEPGKGIPVIGAARAHLTP